jgi:DNA-binding beta-propeller fold protein YncE
MGCAPDATSTAVDEVGAARGGPRLLIANTRGNNVLELSPTGAARPRPFITAGAGGLEDPDSMAIGPDGALYVSSGATPEHAAVLRFDARTGAFLNVFASGNGLNRPYGLAFGPDGLLYVSSFRSDALLRFNGRTGAFIDVFARGNGLPGGLNGPNGLAFGPDGMLYITTEGSVGGTFPGLPSEVLRMNVRTGTWTVFVQQPTPAPSSFGFVSFVGMAFGPNCASRAPGHCDLFVSDFANDVRRYDLRTGALKAQLDTNYTGTTPSHNFIGSLTFGVGGQLFVAGFDNEAEGNPGAVLRYNGFTNAPLPRGGLSGALFVAPTPTLARPIGILAINPGR